MVRQEEAVNEHQQIHKKFSKKNQGERSQECAKPAVDSLRRTYPNKQPRRPPLQGKVKAKLSKQMQRQCAIHAKGKGITILNASKNQSQMYHQRMRMTLPT